MQKTMQNKRINLLDSTAYLAFLLMPFFKPMSLDLIAPKVALCLDIWRILSFILIFVTYLLITRPSKMILVIAAYEGALFLSTVINSGDYWRLAVSCGTVIGFCMLTEMCIKQNALRFFSTTFGIYFILITINLIVLLLYPNGIAVDEYYRGNTYNFLGIDNGLAVSVSLPLMTIACIHSAFRRRKYTFASILMIVMISATMLITWSATGVVAWFILFSYILIVYKRKLARLLNAYVLFLIFIIMQVTIVFLRLQEHFSYIIETILGKTISFSGRTSFWDMTYIVIAQSPIIGHGVYQGHGLIGNGSLQFYSHNAVLEIMTQSGAVGLILFIIPFIMAARKLFQYRDHFLAGIVAVTLFSFLITFLMEAPITAVWLFGFLIIAENISDVIAQYETAAQRWPSHSPHVRLSYSQIKAWR